MQHHDFRILETFAEPEILGEPPPEHVPEWQRVSGMRSRSSTRRKGARRHLEEQALSWNCTRLDGVVNSANARAAASWERLGFRELYRRESPRAAHP